VVSVRAEQLGAGLSVALVLLAASAAPALAAPSVIEKLLSQVQAEVIDTLVKVFSTVLTIMRVAYFVLGAIGVFLWASGIESYRGRKLIIGAIILAIAVEYLSQVSLLPQSTTASGSNSGG